MPVIVFCTCNNTISEPCVFLVTSNQSFRLESFEPPHHPYPPITVTILGPLEVCEISGFLLLVSPLLHARDLIILCRTAHQLQIMAPFVWILQNKQQVM